MKKIIFLLLLITSSIYAQSPTGQEQEFDYGIRNNAAQIVTSTDTLVTHGVGGTYGKITFKNLTSRKAYLSTGLLKNGALLANVDLTKFDITAGIGIISNFDDPENPVSTIINFPAFTGVTPAYLLTGNITYVAINSVPAVVMQSTPFTDIQRRDLIELGAVIHSNLTTINVINNISSPSNAGTNQLHDLMDFIGALNLTGNKYSPNLANLQLNKSAGVIGKRGVNFVNNWKDPHRLAQSAGTALTFRYRTQNGTEGTDRINLDPALYDLNNVLTAVPNNKFTIQTVVMFQSGETRLLYGQNTYDDLPTAKAAVFTRAFNVESNSQENGIIRAYVIMRNTTTSLQNPVDADILEAQKFGGVASGGVALTFANIVSALGYTPENVANKTGTLTASSTSYPNNDAVIAGLATKQNTLTNPITGTGTSGTIPVFTGASIVGDSQIKDVSTYIQLGNGTNAEIRGSSSTIGGTTDLIFRSATPNISTQLKILPNGTSTMFPAIQLGDSFDSGTGSNVMLFGRGNSTLPSSNTSYIGNTVAGNAFANSFDLAFLVSNTSLGRFQAFTIKNSGVINSSNLAGAANRLIFSNSTGDISATANFTHTGNATFVGTSTVSSLNISTLPTTSAGTYDILTRNIATGVVEKVASGGIATSGSYTPTAGATVNVSVLILDISRWTKIGDMVTVQGSASVTPTATGGAYFSLSLPFNRALATTKNIGSGNYGISATATYGSCFVQTLSTTEARVYFSAASTNIHGVNFQYTYLTTE